MSAPQRPGWILAVGLVNAVPPALASIAIARYRRQLLRPEWRLGRTLLVHGALGLAYAAVTALAILALSEWSGLVPAEMQALGPWVSFVYRMVLAFFLYLIFIGVLLWSESIRRVQESHRVAAREAVLRAEAEARAVRAQFNPHFVFNTLHSLMLLVRADPATAERAIEDVATLIRYASILQRSDIDAVPLAKELEVARRYVALEKLRLGDRLTVDWQVDIEPETVSLPAFALQTLVENAVKHGIEPNPGRGTVRVAVLREGDTLHVRVEDDGSGATRSDVESGTGHGLALLRRRLEARYGGRGRLEWSSAPGAGFRVELSLPVERPTHMPRLDVIAERPAPAVVPDS